jgi:hypothetical protein
MAIFNRLLAQAAAKLARDPRIRAKAAEVVEREVVPRAAAAWARTRPKLESARDELRDIAEEADPREDPRAFAAKVRQRIIDGRESD